MLISLLSFITLATSLAGQAPWPQVYKDSDHTQRGDAAWPRSSQVSLQPLVTFPLNTPVLIGLGDILYGGSLDGNIYAVTKTGEVLWTLYLGGGDCGVGFFLNEIDNRLYCGSNGGRIQVVDVTLSPPNITSDALYPPSSLMVMGEDVFLLFGDNKITCWNTMFFPVLRWAVPFDSQYVLEDAATHKNKLFFLQSADNVRINILTAFDLFSGYELWNVTISAVYDDGCLIISGDIVITVLNNYDGGNCLNAYDSITGVSLWNFSALEIKTRPSLTQNGFLITPKYSINATNGDLTPLSIPPSNLHYNSQILDTSGSLFLAYGHFLYAFDIQSGASLFAPFFFNDVSLSFAMASDGTLFLSSQAVGIFYVVTPSSPSPSPNASISSSPSTTLSPSPSTPPVIPSAAPPASSPSTPSGLVIVGWVSLGSLIGVLAGWSLVYLYLRGRTTSVPPHSQPHLAGGDYMSVQ